ncbi:MAG: alanine--tRNA ligase [Deltaproteobacteria bacterium RIFOXYA12_FULL_61_11]|nr:MAG: alanine--tRNA ligase [Deltaproteobacteria bacterium RIFOXYA12_FULL_61_11]
MDFRTVRRTFLDYFIRQHHRLVRSSPVIPFEDPTLLFTNAGMNQFKDQLLGLRDEGYRRACSVQKCIRAGGKHNDLDAVGKDGRHLTFFEMLGNWSFGDYYKREAIEWAWNLSLEGFGLDPSRIHVSVYKDDDEAYELWRTHIGVPPERIVRLGDLDKGDEENFWSMGPTGPCGPCTELYYDLGPAHSCGKPSCGVGCDCDRYFEYWNNVFMEFNRQADGAFVPLAFKSVDTGLGLERLTAILNGKVSVFETDAFQPLIQAIRAAAPVQLPEEKMAVACNVVADHVRSVSVSLADGAFFSNEGRGYVLRRILRRGVRFCRELGFREPFIYKLVAIVAETLGDVYPELHEKRGHVEREIRTEEQRFLATLDHGLDLFDKTLATLPPGTGFPGEAAFKLHDTYGFPVDLTEIMLGERGATLDRSGFDQAMEAQRTRGRSAMKFYEGAGAAAGVWVESPYRSDDELAGKRFVGYHTERAECRVLRYRAHGEDQFELVLDRTPFYAESGGQVADTGTLEGCGLCLAVQDVQRNENDLVVHRVACSGALPLGLFDTSFVATVDGARRQAIRRNHTATHLLHRALRDLLGEGVHQAGSKVSPEALRFDFNTSQRLEPQALRHLETAVNAAILANLPVEIHEDLPLEEARRHGAMALFGEKYGDLVRMVQIEDVSLELCGGTHARRTGDLGSFVVTEEGSIASGVRRIEARTGEGALTYLRDRLAVVEKLGKRFGVVESSLDEHLGRLADENKELRRQVEKLGEEVFVARLPERLASVPTTPKGTKVLVEKLPEGLGRNELLRRADLLRDRLGSGVVALTLPQGPKLALVLTVTPDLQAAHPATDLLKTVTERLGGSGGGKPHLAQGSLADPARFPELEALLLGVLG